jgi:hypothetical protein
MSNMINLSSYLEKFKNLKDPKEDKIIICRLISETAGVEVKEKEIKIQNKTLFIQGSMLSKNRIFLQKEAVLKKINESLPDLQVKEII